MIVTSPVYSPRSSPEQVLQHPSYITLTSQSVGILALINPLPRHLPKVTAITATQWTAVVKSTIQNCMDGCNNYIVSIHIVT